MNNKYILQTKKFKFSTLKKLLNKSNKLELNRNINANHVKSLIKSIKACGLLKLPLIADVSAFDEREYVIADGQHTITAIVATGFNNKKPVLCLVKKYKTKQQLINDIAMLNTNVKKWDGGDFLNAWYKYGKDNVEHWTYYSTVYNAVNEVYLNLSVDTIVQAYTNSMTNFKNGKLTFFDKEWSEKLLTILHKLNIKFKKTSHALMGLLVWAKKRYKKNLEIDFKKLDIALDHICSAKEGKECNGRNDFKNLVQKAYNNTELNVSNYGAYDYIYCGVPYTK